MNPRNPGDSDDDTRYLGPASGSGGGERPRQYFPGDQGQDHRYQQPQYEPQYEQGYAPASVPEEKSGNGLPMLLGILFGLALIAAAVFFLLWRSAAAEADKEPPPPVTETRTIEQTVTVTEEAVPFLPTEIPSDIPSEIPSDILPSDLPDIDLGGLLDQLTGGQEPAPAQ